jgi:hypothetical protein
MVICCSNTLALPDSSLSHLSLPLPVYAEIDSTELGLVNLSTTSKRS